MSNQRDTDVVLHQREHESLIATKVDLTGYSDGDMLFVDEDGVIRPAKSPGVWAWARRFFSDDYQSYHGVIKGCFVSAGDTNIVYLSPGVAIADAPSPDDGWPIVFDPNNDSPADIYDLFDAPHATLDRIDLVYLAVDTNTGAVSAAVATGTPDVAPEAPSRESVVGVNLFTVEIPADEPDATLWTFTSVATQGTISRYTKHISVYNSRDQRYVFEAVAGNPDNPATDQAGFFGTGMERQNRPTIDPTDITGNETEVLEDVVNLLIAMGLVINGTP